MARGEKAIRSVYEGLLSANTVMDVGLSEVVYKTMGATSLAWGKFSLIAGREVPACKPAVMTGRFTEIAEQRGGRWLYTVDLRIGLLPEQPR